MEFAFTLAVWIVIVAVPCSISLLIGDWIGTRRAKRVLADVKASAASGAGEVDPSQAFLVESWRLEGRVAPRAPQSEEQIGPLGTNRLQRRQTFSMMPPLDDLRAEADAIRCSEKHASQSVWEKPGEGTADQEAPQDQNVSATEMAASPDLLRLSTVAPLELSTKADELERQRLSLSPQPTVEPV